mgnify:CR=1 FL=1
MKRIIILLLAFCAASYSAENTPNNFAAGFILGTTNGINLLSYDSSKGQGYQGTLSLSTKNDSSFSLAIDKLFFFDASESLPIYLGIGVKISDEENKFAGVRGVFGVSYFVNALSNNRFEVLLIARFTFVNLCKYPIELLPNIPAKLTIKNSSSLLL